MDVVENLLSYLAVHFGSGLLLLSLFRRNQLIQLLLLFVHVFLVLILDLFYHLLMLRLHLVIAYLLAVLVLLADHLLVFLKFSFRRLVALFRDLLAFLGDYFDFFGLPKSSLDLKLSLFIYYFRL